MFKDIVIGIRESISGFFGGIINAFIQNPEIAIYIAIGIIVIIILRKIGII